MNPIQKLNELGQSVWYDNIQRSLLTNGELITLINKGEITGVTSNPSIFQNAIAKSTDYDTALLSMAWSGMTSDQILDNLLIEDIQLTTDLFMAVYERSNKHDGYVSLEVNPDLANNSEATIKEAQRLWWAVNRPNLMIKIPATQAGVQAISQAIVLGINVNVTLIFSLSRYAQVIEAYLRGLEQRLAEGMPIEHIASVASFFVSRVDTKVDKLLIDIIQREEYSSSSAQQILGKAAVANARMAYTLFQKVIQGDRFNILRNHAAQMQRPLWASTSTKNPDYSDVKYVEELIAPDTINTIPPVTLDAYRDHGHARLSFTHNQQSAHQVLESLANLGISMEQVTQELEAEGVRAFADSFRSLHEVVETRRALAVKGLQSLKEPIARRVKQLYKDNVVERLFRRDASLWIKNSQIHDEVRNRLGWLDLPTSSQTLLEELYSLKSDVLRAGYSHILLIGMGGSSLTAEVLSGVFGDSKKTKENAIPQFIVLDSTDPVQILRARNWSAVQDTLHIISSKSGQTTEVTALHEYFWEEAMKILGERSGEHFIAITDPGTPLELLARERGFHKVILADPLVGGRNSALSAFGLVPGVLIGVDPILLLNNACVMAAQCSPGVLAARNPGLVLGAILAEAALHGRDKLTLICDSHLSLFGDWLEQLIAESTGKDGKGLIPVTDEVVTVPQHFGEDRLFVYLRKKGDYDKSIENLLQTGHPVLTMNIPKDYDIGGEFYRWEIATAIIASILEVNSFNQPDVQDSKMRTAMKLSTYKETSTLFDTKPVWDSEGVQVFWNKIALHTTAISLRDILLAFLKQGVAGEYVAINAFLTANEENKRYLQQLKLVIREITHLAVTVGFGPRYLHSTGQLHKGGPATGLYLILTTKPDVDIEIPGQGYSFSVLQRAQAVGDYEALVGRNRRVMRLHLSSPDILAEIVLKVKDG